MRIYHESKPRPIGTKAPGVRRGPAAGSRVRYLDVTVPSPSGFPTACRSRRAPLGRGPGLSPGLRLGTGARPAVVTPLITQTGSVATSDPYNVEIHLLLTGVE